MISRRQVARRPAGVSPAERRYREVTPRSRAAFAAVHPLIPGAAPGGIGALSPYPLFIERARGGWAWDADGRKVLDLWQGDWLLPLGHGNPRVNAAIRAQLEKGTTYASPDPVLGRKLVSLIRKRMPSVERMRFCTSGSEADLLAIRLARRFTGRTKVAKWQGAYHGTSEPVLHANAIYGDPKQSHAGLSANASEQTVLLPYNDIDGCERLLKRHQRDLACILVEPILGTCAFITPRRDFLPKLVALARRLKILVIFDEVVTFSMGPGGAQGHYGVRPDLTTFGKAIGGGLALAAVGGRADILDLMDPVKNPPIPPIFASSTLGGQQIALAAGVAAVEQLTPSVHRHLTRLGDAARAEILRIARKHAVPMQATGIAQFVGYHWTADPVLDYESFRRRDGVRMRNLALALHAEGVLHCARGMAVFCAAMGERELKFFASAFEKAVRLAIE